MKFGLTRREIKPVTKEQKEDFSNRFKENNVGFKDKFAMLVAAFITIILPCLLVIGAISLLVLTLFGVWN